MEEQFDLELVIMELITNAGNARSLAIEAIRASRSGDFEEAAAKLQECDVAMIEAHQAQTNLLVEESNGNSVPMSLVMVHAQDHIMNAMTVRDLAVELVGILQEKK